MIWHFDQIPKLEIKWFSFSWGYPNLNLNLWFQFGLNQVWISLKPNFGNTIMHPSEPPPVNGALYFVSGKVASINQNFPVSEDMSWSTYLCIIDADWVCHCFLSPSTWHWHPSKDGITPWTPWVPWIQTGADNCWCSTCCCLLPFSSSAHSLFTQACFQTAPWDILFDVWDYIAGTQHMARHTCNIPTTNPQFVQKASLPDHGRLVQMVRSITDSLTEDIRGEHTKWLLVKVANIQFLGTDSPIGNTPTVSGQAFLFHLSMSFTWHWHLHQGPFKVWLEMEMSTMLNTRQWKVSTVWCRRRRTILSSRPVQRAVEEVNVI